MVYLSGGSTFTDDFKTKVFDNIIKLNTESETWETVAKLRNPRGGHGSSLVRVEDYRNYVLDCKSTTNEGCGSPHWKGDNVCNDENNNKGCGWDGGDCCGDNVKTANCSSCQCLDPNFYSEAINSTWQIQDLNLIDSTVKDFMTNYKVEGTSLALVKDGKLVYAKGFGVMDKNTMEPVQATSLFRIASLSKPITSAALMMMIEKNLTSLEAKIFGQNGILGTEYGTQAYSEYEEQITLQHLLEHTAGGESWSNDPWQKDPMWNHMGFNFSQLIGWVLDTRNPTVQPGTKHVYSNFGFCVLGRVIEKLTGQSYESYVQENVLRPIGATGMKIGRSKVTEKDTNEVTYYDYHGNDEVPYYPHLNIERMDAHGGWISSTVDLARFLVHFDGMSSKTDLISKSTYDIMTTASSVKDHYAKGWQVNNGNGNIWHGGNLPGTGAFGMTSPSRRISAVFFMNYRFQKEADAMMWKIIRGIQNWPNNLDLF